MANRGGPDLDHAIDQLERRIEVRRNRLVRHVEELRDATRERAKPLPWIGLATFAVAGFALARGWRGSGAAARSRATGTVARTGVLAGIAGLVQFVSRVVSNPLVRSAWRAYRRPEARYR